MKEKTEIGEKEVLIKAENLYFSYQQDYVLKDLNFEMNKGELVVIVGGNGSGKSTFLKLVIGELSGEGKLEVLGKELQEGRDYREIAYVPQNQNVNQIAFPLTCREMLVLNLYRDMGIVKIPRRAQKEKAERLLEKMGLKSYQNTPFNELSGGLQQRVMISRALINNPKLLILDEPTSGIDKDSKEEFLYLLQKLNDEGVAIVLVTHELELVKNYLKADRLLEMNEGRLISA